MASSLASSQLNVLQDDENRTIVQDTAVISRARSGDDGAVRTIFESFLPVDEPILLARYLGRSGWLWAGKTSFGCVTPTRVATVQAGAFGEVLYQDALISDIGGLILYQPSRLMLYVLAVLLLLLAIPTLGVSLLDFLFLRQIYYRLVKSGIMFKVRFEGVNIYMFADRKNLDVVRGILELVSPMRRSTTV